jgi:hypothetical protein
MEGSSLTATGIGNDEFVSESTKTKERLFRTGKTNRMALITVKLTEQELGLLATLASDQLFRREFIDPKMPSNKFNPAEIGIGKKLVERLRLLADRAKKTPPTRVPYAV